VAWELLRDLEAEKKRRPHLVALQEHRLEAQEQSLFANAALRCGYVMYATAPWQSGVSGTASGRQYGGVMLLVRANIPSRLHCSVSLAGGQFVMVWVREMLVASVYMGHVAETLDAAIALVESSKAARIRAVLTPFFFMGDWNMQPEENCVAAALEDLGAEIFSTGAPTRWQARRCIDYGVGSSGVCSAALASEEKYADHMLVMFSLQAGRAQDDGSLYTATRTEDLRRPPGVAQEKWEEEFTKFFLEKERAQHVAGDIDIDSAWRKLNASMQYAGQKARDAILTVKLQETPAGADNTARNICREKGTEVTIEKVEAGSMGYRHAGEETEVYQVRVLRRLCGRLAEVVRQDRCGEIDAALLDKVGRCALLRVGGSWAEAFRNACEDLEKHRATQRQERITAWRERMQDDRAAYRWLRRVPQAPTHRIRKDDAVATCMDEAFALVREHWREIWRRDVQVDMAAVRDALGEEVPEQQWGDFFDEQCEDDMAKHVLAEMRRKRGSSAGLDGWSGDEVGDMPLVVAKAFLHFMRRCLHAGRAPATWTQIRQVQLRKPGAQDDADGCLMVKDLRPVSIMSVWWRVFTSAVVRSASCRSWVDQWAPHAFYGGRPGIGAMDALLPLVEHAVEERYLGTVDLSAAFDYVDPRRVGEVFHHLGMPRLVAELVVQVWSSQRRLITMGSFSDVGLEIVRTSMPQGDALSVLGMLAWLVAPVRDIQRRFPTIEQVVYVDDRSWAARGAEESREVEQAWAEWSMRLGLRENTAKAQHFAFTKRGRRRLVAAGVSENSIKTDFRVLGASLAPAARRRINEKEAERLARATVVGRKVAVLPLSRRRRLRIARATVTPIACWGWIARRPAEADVKKVTAVMRKISGETGHGAPDLRQIFRGHLADVRFAVLLRVLAAARRRAAANGTPGTWRARGWCGELRKGMRSMGWSEVAGASWTWRHAELVVSLDRDGGRWCARPGELEHRVREGWRRWLFGRWLGSTRVDAVFVAAGGGAYDEKRCQVARQWAEESGHALGVLTGALWSPVKLYKASSAKILLRCPWCGLTGACEEGEEADAANFEHITRTCRSARVPGQPADRLQARLGWPTADAARKVVDRQWFEWLLEVREAMVQQRLAHKRAEAKESDDDEPEGNNDDEPGGNDDEPGGNNNNNSEQDGTDAEHEGFVGDTGI
jgi:hypothetical protein